jgi:hypothetical protein
MNQTLSLLLGRRMWLVPGVVIWGEMAGFEPEFILTENDGSARRILHGSFRIGGQLQVLKFADLVDQRGNNVPAILANPSVVPIPRGSINVVVQGSPDSESVRLAQSLSSNQAVVADLLIIELG